MSKKTFVIFGLLVLFLAVLIPWLAFRSDGESAPEANVPSDLKDAKALFDVNCGNCHTLYAAETDGNFGPNLDDLLAPAGPVEGSSIETNEGRVIGAIEKGVDSTTEPGRMPAGILNGEQAKEVAEFVARTAGQG
jgi:mono/diheme cytochrome c family protein